MLFRSLLDEKETELAAKSADLAAKESELVAKTGELARLCIKSQLSKLTVKVCTAGT